METLTERSRNRSHRCQLQGDAGRFIFSQRDSRQPTSSQSDYEITENGDVFLARNKGLDNCWTNVVCRPCSYLTSLPQGRGYYQQDPSPLDVCFSVSSLSAGPSFFTKTYHPHLSMYAIDPASVFTRNTLQHNVKINKSMFSLFFVGQITDLSTSNVG